MKLNIVAESEIISDALGISKERHTKLMNLCSKLPLSGTLTTRMGHIAAFCDTIEEYTLCMAQDIRWLIRTGVMSVELTEAAKKKFGQS